MKNETHCWPGKAYNNYSFLNSPSARILRVLAELIEPQSRFKKYNINNTVVFFGSARTLPRPAAIKNLKEIETKISKAKVKSAKLMAQCQHAKHNELMSRYYEDAVKLSQQLTYWFKEKRNAHKNFVICSGGGPGIMEAANRGARNAGGKSIGLNISLPDKQKLNPYQSKELTFEFHYFFIRKFWFFYLAKALVVFPGGYGTLDELFELLTLVQTNKSKKYMPIVLYGSQYWKKIIDFDEMIKWGTISPTDLKLFKIYDNVDDAFTYLKNELTNHYI